MGFINSKTAFFPKLVLIVCLGIYLVSNFLNVALAAPATGTYTINLGSDDVNEDGTNFDVNGQSLWLGNGQSAISSYSGLRFGSVNIPQGAVITSAKLMVYSSKNQWIGMSFNYFADAAGNSAAFTSSNKPSQRTLSSSFVGHSSGSNWKSGTWYTLDEIGPVIQEIVSRADWQPGNALSVVMKGTGAAYGRKFIRSRNSSASLAPQLVVTYEQGSPSPSPSPSPSVNPSPSPSPSPVVTPSPSPSPSPSPVSSPSLSPSSSPTPVTAVNFRVGAGYVDNVPRQIVRASNNKLYLFAPVIQTPGILKAYWNDAGGFPSGTADFSGTAQINNSSPVISADAVYDGAQTVHVLLNDMTGTIKDYPFDTSTNTFKPVISVTTGAGKPGLYTDIGTTGISGMFDKNGTLHLAYWTSSNQIMYDSFTYDLLSNTLTLTSGPTRLDSLGGVNHPQLIVSPFDNSVTVAWVNGSSGSGTMSSRVKTASGIWGTVEQVSASPVWTSSNAGINIDQGPSMIVTSDGVKHLIYIENFDTTGSYGKLHYVKNAGSGWVDTGVNQFYTHAPGIATNSLNELYVIGHGHPNNPSCKIENDLCYIKKNNDETWGNPVTYAVHLNNDIFDVSASIKWSAVGWNSPEAIEFLFFSANNGSYQNTDVWYGRLEASVSPTPTPISSPIPSTTSTPTPLSSSTPLPSPTPTPIPSALAHVQSILSYSTTFVPSQTAEFSQPVTSGNTVIVAVSTYTNAGAGVASVTDNFGNIYTKAVQNNSANHHISIWYAPNISGGGGVRILVTPSTGTQYISVAAHEYSGVSSIAPLDQTQSNSGTGTAADTLLTQMTTVADELVFGAFLHEDSADVAASVDPLFSLRLSQTNGNYEPVLTADKIINQIGQYNLSLTWAQPVSWRGVVATFKSL